MLLAEPEKLPAIPDKEVQRGRHSRKTSGRDSEFRPVILRRNVGEEELSDLRSAGDDKPRTSGDKPGTLSAPQIVLPHSFLGPIELDLFTDSIIDRKSKKHGSRKRR